MPDQKPPGKPVKLYVSPEIHAALRVIAAEDGVPMSQWVQRLVAEAVKARKKPKKKSV